MCVVGVQLTLLSTCRALIALPTGNTLEGPHVPCFITWPIQSLLDSIGVREGMRNRRLFDVVKIRRDRCEFL
jgi:hypothetical protein